MNSRSGRVWLAVLVASGLVLAAGLILFATGESTASFGWFAYAPLTSNVVDVRFLPSPWQRWGVVLAALGFGSICALTGYRIGSRRPVR